MYAYSTKIIFFIVFGFFAYYGLVYGGITLYSRHTNQVRNCARCTNRFPTSDMKKLSKLDWKVPGRVCGKCFEILKRDMEVT